MCAKTKMRCLWKGIAMESVGKKIRFAVDIICGLYCKKNPHLIEKADETPPALGCLIAN